MRAFLGALEEFRGEDLLEVGPGTGAITVPASSIARRIVAVEVDRELALSLAARAPPNVSVVIGDGVSHLLATRLGVLLSNTPFNISSRLLVAAARNNNVRAAVLGVQLEVARRVTASPGEPDYGRLSVIVRAHFNVDMVAVLPSSWFSPRPKVNAGVLVLRRRRPWSPASDALERLTACLFSQRNRLAAKVLERCGLSGRPEELRGRRVRELSPDELLGMASWLVGARTT